MKAAVLAVVVLALACPQLPSAEYCSDFGFCWDIPEGWVVFTQRTYIEDSQLLKKHSELLDGVPSYSVESMERALKAGMLEWYVDGASGPRPSIENINVVWESLRAARTEVELETARRSITKLCDELSLASGRPLEVHSCEFVGLEELAAVRMHFDHPVPQTHCVQYQLAHEVGGRLVFTIASGDSTWKATDASLQQMLGTLRFVEPKSSPIQLGQ